MTDLLETVRFLKTNRVAAHRVLFKGRHRDDDALFHDEMIHLFHGKEPNVCFIAFRGSAKSTIFEEGITIEAALREFQNCIVFGANEDRAIERVHVIKRQIEKNGKIRDIFGDLEGQPWTDGRLELSNGVRITAMGRGQALRGAKGEELRPDFVVFDDIEDRESVANPANREKTAQWVFGDVLPMMDRSTTARVRMAANDLDIDCLANTLKRPGSGFSVRVYPIEYQDPLTGERKPSWPARFPLDWIDDKRKQMIALGRLPDFNKEYMCHSEAPEDKPFKPDMMRNEAVARTWHAVYGFFDPARSIKATSADTGFACWSYIGGRIVVWDAWGKKLLPDEIVKAVFDFHDEMNPAYIGIEEDGLNEFLLQPLRQEAIRRGVTLPLRPMKAPKGKLDFIRGLQPFYAAREVIHAKPIPDLENQLKTFPSGLIDVPNALAYAQRMRPGAPIYDQFTGDNIVDGLNQVEGRPVHLALNATPGLLTAALVQGVDGVLRVLADWVREGDPVTLLQEIVREANLEAGRTVRVISPPSHFERFTNVGLRAQCARLNLQLERGSRIEDGRAQIRKMIVEEVRQQRAVQVSTNARWTANAFAAGYAREILKGGILGDQAVEGPYKTLMEGLESYAGLFKVVSQDDEEQDIAYDQTPSGRRFISARR